ncbi:tRNA lysidine(34) synthetase TilS [Maledivibacter halophilus]|nr:tRNA lysidine(34) synthetase TilS [Maledivibacter halophilus]
MDIMEKFLETIEKNNLIEKNEKIVIGVSGGPDSICLLHLIWRLRKDLNIEPFVVHLNHQFRGKEAKKDEKYVEEFCQSLGVKLFIFSYDVSKYSSEKGISFEVGGRELRYGLFHKVAKQTGATKIAIAQNRNDQAETVLMRLIRGAGLDGLTAIDYKRDGNIIRPLLDISRKEIDDYCEKNALMPRIDKTNLEAIYTRNKIRLELIPYIEKNFNPAIIEALWRSSNLLKEDNSCLNLLTEEELQKVVAQKNNNQCLLSKKKFDRLHIAIKKRILRRSIKQVKGDLKDIGFTHIENILDLIHKKNVGSRLDLPGHITVQLGYNSIDIKNNKALEKKNFDFNYKLNIAKTTYIKELSASIKLEIIHGSDINDNTKNLKTAFIDYNKVSGDLTIRNRKRGDRFKPLGMRGSKKIKDYFIDKKVPKEIRNKIPILCDEKGIIWVIGYRMSEEYKVDNQTKKMIKITYMEGCLEN